MKLTEWNKNEKLDNYKDHSNSHILTEITVLLLNYEELA